MIEQAYLQGQRAGVIGQRSVSGAFLTSMDRIDKIFRCEGFLASGFHRNDGEIKPLTTPSGVALPTVVPSSMIYA